MAKYFSNVQETTITEGTGPVTLVGATAGNRTFSAVLAVDDYVPYNIQASDGQFERGYTKYSATNIIDRDFVMESSNAGAAITLPAGTHTVTLAPTPEMGVRRGYQLEIVGGTYLWPGFTLYNVPYQTTIPLRDTEGLFAPSYATDLIVPAWVSRIRVDAELWINGAGTLDISMGLLDLQDAAIPGAPTDALVGVDVSKNPIMRLSGTIDTPLDAGGNRGFSVYGAHISGSNLDTAGGWVSVEFLG